MVLLHLLGMTVTMIVLVIMIVIMMVIMMVVIQMVMMKVMMMPLQMTLPHLLGIPLVTRLLVSLVLYMEMPVPNSAPCCSQRFSLQASVVRSTCSR